MDNELVEEAEAFLGEPVREAHFIGDGITAVTLDGLRVSWKFSTTIKEVRERVQEARRRTF